MPRTAADAAGQPNIPAALRVILGALPNDRLAGLLYELARVAGVISAPLPATPSPQPAAGKRGPGWPKGRPRKVKGAGPAAGKALPAVPAGSPDAKLRAKRDRENAARKARRVAAKAANGANGAHTTSTAATPPPPAMTSGPETKRAKQARSMRDLRAKRAARETSDAGKAAGTTAAARLWAHAVAIDPREPWRPVAGRLNLNMAACVDAWRSKSLPASVTPAEVTRFIEPAPN